MNAIHHLQVAPRRCVLIAGGGGFVGSHLAAGLARAGHRVIALDQAFDAEAMARLAGVRIGCAALADLAGLGWLSAAGIEVVVHAAALTARPAELGVSDAGYLRHEIAATLAAFELASDLQVSRLFFISSAAVFAPWPGRALDEAAIPDAVGPYASAKRAGEVAAACLHASGAMAVTTIRLGNVYGPDEAPRPSRPRTSLVHRMIAQARAGEAIAVARPDAVRDWLFVDDLAPAMDRLLAQPACAQAIHLCAPLGHADMAVAEAVAARWPGSRIAIEANGGDGDVRPPLISRHRPTFDIGGWTSLQTGLAHAMTELPQNRSTRCDC